MANIMHTRCPHCEKIGPHPVTTTDPVFRLWDDHTDFRLRTETGRDLRYRTHTRECSNCCCSFSSYEIAQLDFNNIMTLWDDDETELYKERSKRKQLEEKYKCITSAFEKLLKQKGRGRINSLNCSVDMLGPDIGYDVTRILKEQEILTLADLMTVSKYDLTCMPFFISSEVKRCWLTEEEWWKIADLFAESGIPLPDDDRQTLRPVTELSA
jgi:hypothetical protein